MRSLRNFAYFQQRKRMLNIVIPAYFGNQYENRKKTMYESIKFLSQVGAPIYILAQEWKDEWYSEFNQATQNMPIGKDSQIWVIEYPKKLGLCGCRNEALKEFLYNTDADFMYMQDNDIRILDIYNIIDLFKIFHTRPQDIEVDMLRALMPNMQGFREFNILNRGIVGENFTFHQNGPYGGGAYFLRNLKKYYNYELYSKDYINGEFVYEDILLQCELIVHGGIAKACEQFWVSSTLTKSTVSDIKIYTSNIEGNIKTKSLFLKLHNLIDSQNPSKDEIAKAFRKVMRDLRPRVKYNIKRNEKHEFTEYELAYKPKSKSKQNITK